MIVAIVVLGLLGSARGLVGTVAGGLLGTAAAAGLVEATRQGELAGLHTPVGLVVDMLPLAGLVLLLALAGSHGAFAAALAWMIGSAAAAFAAPQAGQLAYVAPLLVNALAATALARIAARRIWTGRAVLVADRGATPCRQERCGHMTCAGRSVSR